LLINQLLIANPKAAEWSCGSCC